MTAYMKFLDPILSFSHSRFDGLKCWFNLGERRGSSSRFCLAKILGVNNEGKGRFVPGFLFLRANIPSCVFVNIENRDCAVCTENRLRRGFHSNSPLPPP